MRRVRVPLDKIIVGSDVLRIETEMLAAVLVAG
jgi:hypothetical protein